METKICRVCLKNLELRFFSVRKKEKDGLNKKCKICVRQYRLTIRDNILHSKKQYYKNNREKILIANKEYRDKNLEKEKERHIRYNSKEENKVKRNEKRRKRLKEDKQFRLDLIFSSAIRSDLKKRNLQKKKPWEEIVGYSLNELIAHLEKQFTPEMNWNNYGSYWHIDHIKPRSLFKYSSINDEELRLCWALQNLQPLKAEENIKKGNKYAEV